MTLPTEPLAHLSFLPSFLHFFFLSFLFLPSFLFFFHWDFFLHVSEYFAYMYCVYAWCPRGEEEGVGYLELELKVTCELHVVLEAGPGSTARPADAFNLEYRSISPALHLLYILSQRPHYIRSSLFQVDWLAIKSWNLPFSVPDIRVTNPHHHAMLLPGAVDPNSGPVGLCRMHGMHTAISPFPLSNCEQLCCLP